MKPSRNDLYVLVNEQGLFISGYVKRYSLLPQNRLRFTRHVSDALLFSTPEDIDTWLRERSDLQGAHLALTVRKFKLVEEQ